MNLNIPRKSESAEPATPSKTKHVTFSDTVEWASTSGDNKEDTPTRKYTFWMLLLGVLAMVVVIWILIMFMSKSSENNAMDSKKTRSSRSRKGSRHSNQRSALDVMMSDSGSIHPDPGTQFVKKASRSRRSNGYKGPIMVNPLP